MSAQQYGMDPNQFAQALDQQGQVPAMVQEVARRKALAAVLDEAKVTDTAGAEVDLDALVPDAPDDAADEAATEQAAALAAEEAAHAEAEVVVAEPAEEAADAEAEPAEKA